MRILFLHPNFPAQFKSPCISLSQEGKHDILFLCQTHHGRHIPGIKKLVLKGRGSHERTLQYSKTEHDRSMYRASVYSEAFRSLKRTGWSPEIVVCHCGWGCGIHVKDIWPKCRVIAYMEWWLMFIKRIQKLLQCYNWAKLLISLNKVLLQKCYKLLQRVTKGFPTRARFKLFLKQKIFCKKDIW